MTSRSTSRTGGMVAVLLATLLVLGAVGTPAQAPPPRKFTFLAGHYEVTAVLTPVGHSLTARARVEFVASAPSRALDVELNPNLKISGVTGADRKPVPFERDADVANLVHVTLPQALNAGEKTTLTFDYSGPLAGDVSQSGALQLAYVGTEGSWLLLPARWFPLTDYPSNRYTGVFDIAVPEDVAVVGTGKSQSPSVVKPGAAKPAAPAATPPAKGRAAAPPAAPEMPSIAPVGSVLYTFRVETPSAAGSFVASNLQLTPVQAEGLSTAVYTPPAQAGTAKAYGESLAQMVNEFSAQFGPIAQPALTLAQFPNVAGAPQGFSGPGLLLVNPRQWDPKVNYRLLAQLAARQWWENEVLPATASDAWLADGLARYSEGLYVLHLAGQEGFNQTLEDFAVGALMYEDAAPIAQAGRLEPFSAEYRSVVMNKGAMVFHMLRGQIGEGAFLTLLKDYHTKFAGKSARIEDFEALARTVAAANPPAGSDKPLNLTPFFGQWLRSTGVPAFKMEYVVYRTQKGFRIVGKVKQDLETFRMKVDVKVETEGNPEVKTIEVMGANSDFVIETFGRPKPGGITLDPSNSLLKATDKLPVRAAIARGEAFAEDGKFYEAVQQYQRAVELQKNSSLAHFRMAEAFFYQKNQQAAANAFRDAIDGDRDPKWVEVWSHIYLGKIFDLSGQRERAVNEYQKAVETNDNTGEAQAEAQKWLKEPFKESEKTVTTP